MTTGQAIFTDQDSKLVETYEGQYVALVLLLIFHLGFEPVSRFSTKLGHVIRPGPMTVTSIFIILPIVK